MSNGFTKEQHKRVGTVLQKVDHEALAVNLIIMNA